MIQGKIIKVSGPLIVAEGMRNANMFDVVRVGEKKLIGEIIETKINEVAVSETELFFIVMSAEFSA